jgi:hypothetical protein
MKLQSLPERHTDFSPQHVAATLTVRSAFLGCSSGKVKAHHLPPDVRRWRPRSGS